MSRPLSFQALGSRILIQGEGAQEAAHEIKQAEALLTRFQPSPLTELNLQGVLLDPPGILVEALVHALLVARQTAGLVTPAVLTALEAAGYAQTPGDRQMPGDWQTPGDRRGAACPVPGTSEVICTPEVICLPPGLRLDLGGTAKSWIAERAFTRMSGDGFVNAGGDLITRQSAAFAVEIAHPFGGLPLYLDCPAGTWGVATSSTLKRAWAGGHHLIDPRTAGPLVSDLVQVTVIGNRPTVAEVLTKLAFLDAGTLDAMQGNAQIYAYDRAGQFWTRSGNAWQSMD